MAYVKPKYTFTTTFINNLKTRIGVDFTEDVEAYIRMMMDNIKPHKKVDNKNRHSEYFTFFIEDVLTTIVCDDISKKVVTCFEETHWRFSKYALKKQLYKRKR